MLKNAFLRNIHFKFSYNKTENSHNSLNFKTNMKVFLISLLLFVCSTVFLNAQVGINTTLPHNSAALHIDGGTVKGLLIPVMVESQRYAVKNPAKGLIVCDTTIVNSIPVFFVSDGENWIAMNPLQASDGNLSTLKLSNGSTITFDNDVIIGNTTLQKSVIINGTLTVNDTINAKNNTINAMTVNVKARKFTASDTINAKTINATDGFGITPIGGIIMWSGTKIPDGWALCDGRITSNGYTTPDLRGRFIVGYGDNGTNLPSNVWDYYTNPGDLSSKGTKKGTTGGEMKHTLIKSEMPRHQHYSRRINHGTLDTGSGNDSSLGQYTDNTYDSTNYYTSFEGNDVPHENRPPYYVLAFIMRVK